MRRSALGILLFLTGLLSLSTQAQPPQSYDVVVYGATPAGVAAAVNAAREGKNVVLIQENGHIGGATSGGLSHSDFRTFEALGGTWLEFMNRVEQHYIKTYGKDSKPVRDCWKGGYYEPRVARLVFEEMLQEAKVQVLLQHRLDGVTLKPAGQGKKKLTGAKLIDLTKNQPVALQGKVFIDATYEGDLMAAAGVPYRVGCEARSEYNESLAPEKANKHVMACNFRVTLTRDAKNSLPLPKPPDYDRKNFAKIAEAIKAGTIKPKNFGGAGWVLDDVMRFRPIPNNKVDVNDKMGSPVGIKLVTESDEWPEASPPRREEIFERAKYQALGLFWFLANDPELPDWVHKAMREWGLPKDEYPDTDHWTPQLYVREGRRMVGATVFTQHDCELHPNSVRSRLNKNSVAIGDYSINSHGTHYDEKGALLGVISKAVHPWQVPYGVLLPKEVDGLLVPVACSASHVGYCAIRMEPTWTGLGQAAGLAAAQALNRGIEVRAVEVPALQKRLHALGAMTIYIADVPPDSPHFKAAQWFGTRGFFHDLIDPKTATEWKRMGLSPVNQWTTAFPYHGVEPKQPIDANLAARWLKRAGVPAGPDLQADSKRTRGEFLRTLWQKVKEC